MYLKQDTDQSTGNNGKLIQAEDNSTQDTLVGAKGNSSTNKEHKGTASVAFSNQAITSHCEEEDTLTDCTSEKSSGKGISESEEASKSLHGDSLCDGSKNSESDCSQRLLNPQGNYPNCPPEVDSKVVTCDSTYSFKDTVKSCEKQNVPEDKGSFQEDQSVLPHTATKNLTAAADEVPPESRKYISVKSLKLSYSDLPKSEDQSQKEKIHPRRNSSGDFEDSESLSGTWSSWSDIDSRRGSSLPRTSFQAFARQISTSSEYSLPETPFPTTSRQNSDFDFDSVLSVRDRSKSLGHVPRFVTIQLQDLTKKRIKVSKMQRRASLSQNLWQVLSENASEDSPLLDSSVSSSDLKKPYHSGWLMSPYDGKRYWCIVADILLCMFDQPTSPRAYKVLVLPGYEIRPIILVSEDENTSHNSQQLQTQDFRQDTGKYQVKLTHQNAGTEFTLCVESQKELHKWTEALRLAASLDHSISTDTDDEESSDDDTGYYSNYSYYNNNNSVFPGLKYRLPSTGSGSGQRMHTDSFNSEENFYDFSKDFLVKDDSSNLGSEFARSSPPILSDLIRVQQSDNVSTSSSTKSSPCSTLERDLDLIDVVDKVPEEADKKAKHERSASEPSRRSFGMKLAKQATKMKERMSLKTPKTKGNVPQDVTLGSLSKAKHSGELELKMKTGWAKYWCVICNKNLYLFKSSQSDEMAEMILSLSGCQASKSQREKLPNVLKISHPAYKRVYLQASQHVDLLKWVDFINREGSPLASSASDSHIKWGGKHKDKDTPINKSNSFASLQRRFGSSHEKKANGKESKENCSPTTQRRMAMLRMSRASFLEGYDGIDDGNDNETEEQSIQDLESNMDSDVFSSSVPSVLRPCYSEDESNGSLSEMESVYSLRKKSLHGSLDDIPGLNLNGKKSKKEKKSKKKMHPISVVHTAAKEWTKASKIGYLNRKCKGPWTRYWAVLNKDTLYLYKTPEDTATVDSMALPGYKVSTDVKTAFKSRKLTFKLVHEVRDSYLLFEFIPLCERN
ncbi:uncharacterized protein [Ptychodera flava]|uniref:uncharacterized protein isoform X2 n=1 Tax=Ptychodera flava TaxID=63121 RepID=UPI003969E2B7